MTLRRFQLAFFATTGGVGAVCGLAWVTKAYWAFAAAILIGSLVLMALCRKTPDAAADERGVQIGGTAAFVSVHVFACIGLGAAFLLFVLQDRNPLFAVIAGTLTASACALVIFYGVLRDILYRYDLGGRLGLVAAGLAVIVTAATLLVVRLTFAAPISFG